MPTRQRTALYMVFDDQKFEKEQARLKILVANGDPRYKILSKGPRKGLVFRKRSGVIREEHIALRRQEEAKVNQQFRSNDIASSKSSPAKFEVEVLYALAFVCFVTVTFAFLFKWLFSAVGKLAILICLCDFVLFSFKTRGKSRPKKYIPLIWWLFH